MLRRIPALAIGGLIISAAHTAATAGESGIGYIQRHHYDTQPRTRNARPDYGFSGTPAPFIDVTGSIGRRNAPAGVRSRRPRDGRHVQHP